MTTIVGWIRERGPLRPGPTTPEAADVLWRPTSPEVHHVLLATRGWTRREYEDWLRGALEPTLLH